MRNATDLGDALVRLEGAGYPAYKAIKGSWIFPGFVLDVLHVQGDPFADASRFLVRLAPDVTGFPSDALASPSRRWGIAALLARSFAREAGKRSRPRGSGKSGRIEIEAPGQEVLPQTAVQVSRDGALEARFRVGLPARGRRILGGVAADLLCAELPGVVDEALRASAYHPDELLLHARTNEDADALRAALPSLGLVGFIADGARLPRRSGVDDRPLADGATVPFHSPSSLRVGIEAPNAGVVTGLGVPEGVTLIVGGGYHGKSTLLRALERGVYNHRPGDGRERVVSLPDAVKIRAEDGRSVASVDISAFISALPNDVDTRRFSTANASGSTSQATAIVEALESGATALLVDEDTSATNFMIRDRRMQALVPKDREPITPFVDRVRELYRARGVSSVLVLGGSGDYLDVADTVIAMADYRPRDVTAEAGQVAAAHPTGRIREVPDPLLEPARRCPDGRSVDPSRGRRSVSIRVRRADHLQFGESEVDLSVLEQLLSRAQARAISEALVLAKERFMSGGRPLGAILDDVTALIQEEGLDVLGRGDDGDLALFRRHEFAGVLNRLRTLRVTPADSGPMDPPGPAPP